MDEALCRTVIDLSGRFYLVYEVQTKRQKIGNFSVELAEHFWRSFAETAKFNLHIDCLRGRNTHHMYARSCCRQHFNFSLVPDFAFLQTGHIWSGLRNP
jgi:imidazoleglycerol phosphate dehydratase HisB